MNFENLKTIFQSYGVKRLYIKKLAQNDNSKNQVYFGGDFNVLNILPIEEIITDPKGDWEKERFKAKIDFAWIQEDGSLETAPKAQLILYPKYPEVRFSGFLSGCGNAPSQIMSTRKEGRILVLGVSEKGRVIGFALSGITAIAKEISELKGLESYGVFEIYEFLIQKSNKEQLISKIREIHNKEWILSKRLDSSGNILPCNAPNCGGYTLEAELGITPNGYSNPDYLGWEIKQFGVKDFEKLNGKVITLMTPEPTDGIYKTKGIEKFIDLYGYADLMGRQDRRNFGGVHKINGSFHSRTNLQMVLIGYDSDTNLIRQTNGCIALIDRKGNIAASWSFSSLLKHWNRKHNKACYIPSMSQKIPELKYYYGHKILLGIGTDFIKFLKEMNLGNIYYDPGIKIENISTKPKIKRRSQFRIKSDYIPNLYNKNEIVNL